MGEIIQGEEKKEEKRMQIRSESRREKKLLSKEVSKRREKEKQRRGTWRKHEEKERKKRRKGRVEFNLTGRREDPRGYGGKRACTRERKERSRTGRTDTQGGRKDWGKKRQGELKERRESLERKRKPKKEGKGKVGPLEWKEEVARVGTGFRVRKHEKDPSRRRFDVGYSDRKEYRRKPGREVVVDQSSMGRSLRGKGEDARVKVINAVCGMEKRRRVSEYTGSGIRRKSRVGKRKLKPTKPQAKQ